MEELNKTQLVLLMLFVSFVTSIATGVVTVTLLEQAPKSVTQQINRVVERTVEKIVPGPGETRTINTTSQVVVSEDDLIIRAVSKSSPALVRIVVKAGGELISSTATSTNTNLAAVSTVGDGEVTPEVLVVGIIVSDTGRIISTKSEFITEDVGKEFAFTYGGVARKAKLLQLELDANLAVFEIVKVSTDEKFPFISFPVQQLSLGQTVILMGLTESNSTSVDIGRITELTKPTASTTGQITTNLTPSTRSLGNPLIDTNGSFAGFIKRSGRVIAPDIIKTAIDKAISGKIDKKANGQ